MIALTDEKIAELWHKANGHHHRFARLLETYLLESRPTDQCPPCNNDCNQGRNCPARKR
jgi:hypothetical protein